MRNKYKQSAIDAILAGGLVSDFPETEDPRHYSDVHGIRATLVTKRSNRVVIYLAGGDCRGVSLEWREGERITRVINQEREDKLARDAGEQVRFRPI